MVTVVAVAGVAAGSFSDGGPVVPVPVSNKETPRKLLLLWLWQAGAWSWRCIMSSMDPIQGAWACGGMEFTRGWTTVTPK